MNLDTSRWDAILISALTTPGTARAPLSRDLATFMWGRWNTVDWSAEQAFTRLGIRHVDFPVQWSMALCGFATVDEAGHQCIGLNPRATVKVETVAHELGHVLLRHTFIPNEATRQPVEEFEAECVALLVCHALELPEDVLSHCRAYIQMFVGLPVAGPLPQTWEHIKRAARTIVAAGAGRFTVVPEPPPLKVLSLDDFSRRLVMGGRAR